MKYFLKKLLGYEKFRSMVSWATKIFFEKFVKPSGHPFCILNVRSLKAAFSLVKSVISDFKCSMKRGTELNLQMLNNYFSTKLFINWKAKGVWKVRLHCQSKILCECKASWANKLVRNKITTLTGLIRLQIVIKEDTLIDFAWKL